MQSLEVPEPIVQCDFAHFISNEIILMVQMNDASLNLYKYHGIAGFKFVHNIEIHGGGSTTDGRPSFSLIENRKGFLELLAINTGQEIGIVDYIFQ